MLSALLTFAVRAIEFAIAICLVLPRWVRVRLLFPVAGGLHLGIILLMGVSSFSMVMFAAPTLFVLPIDTGFRAIRIAAQRRFQMTPDGSTIADKEVPVGHLS